MRSQRSTWLLAGALIPGLASGCIHFWGMGVATPIPVQPWVTENIQERIMNKNDHRSAIMPPIPPGHRPLCEDPPDRAEILRAMPRVARGIPG